MSLWSLRHHIRFGDGLWHFEFSHMCPPEGTESREQLQEGMAEEITLLKCQRMHRILGEVEILGNGWDFHISFIFSFHSQLVLCRNKVSNPIWIMKKAKKKRGGELPNVHTLPTPTLKKTEDFF